MKYLKKILIIYIINIVCCNALNSFSAGKINSIPVKYQKFGRTSVSLELEYKNLFSSYIRFCSGVLFKNKNKQVEIITSVKCINNVQKSGLFLKLVGINLNYLSPDVNTIRSFYLTPDLFTIIYNKDRKDNTLEKVGRLIKIQLKSNDFLRTKNIKIPTDINEIVNNKLIPQNILLDTFERFFIPSVDTSFLWCGQNKYKTLDKYYPVCGYYKNMDDLPFVAKYNSDRRAFYYLRHNTALNSVNEEDLGGPLFLCQHHISEYKLKCYLLGIYSFDQKITSKLNSGLKSHSSQVYFSILSKDMIWSK